MRPSAFTDGNAEPITDDRAASMRPSAFTDGNLLLLLIAFSTASRLQ